MALSLVTPPSSPLFSLAEARLHLRLDAFGSPPAHPEDDLVAALVKAVAGELDGPTAWLGRSLITQTWKLTLDTFPCDRIVLPLPPLQAVNSIQYVAPDGTLTTLSPSVYRLMDEDEPGFVEPVYGSAWPATRHERGAVRVEYVCGYGDADDVPELIKAYAKLRLGQLFENREAIIRGSIVNEQPWVRDMLESYRVRGVML